MRNLLAAAFIVISVVATAQCYTVAPVAYTPDTSSIPHTPVAVVDDQWSQPVPIGFTFCFFGNQYTDVLVGANSILTFNTNLAGGYCMWPIPPTPIPNTQVPMNSIMLPWQDLYIDSTCTISYWTQGMAPNRIFTVEYQNVKMYSCTSSTFSGRVSLFETTNKIEMQIDQKPLCAAWNSGRGTQGILSANGMQGLAVSGRNANSWAASQDGYLFTPVCDVCTGVSVGEDVGENFVRLYPNPTSGATAVSLSQGHSFSTIEIVDAMGRVVERRAVVQGTAQTIEFSIAVAGIYFVRMMNTEQEAVRTEKLIVE